MLEVCDVLQCLLITSRLLVSSQNLSDGHLMFSAVLLTVANCFICYRLEVFPLVMSNVELVIAHFSRIGFFLW